MKTTKTILCCLLFFGVTATSNAQFWKKLKKKVEQKVEEKIDKETDKAIDNALNGSSQKEESKIIQSIELPKFTGGSGILKMYSYGYEYMTQDIAISVYGKFNKTNLSNSIKTYKQDRVIKPVDAYPEGYALAFNGSGFLNPHNGQITIHHADTTKVVFSIKGTWNTIDGNVPVNGAYISLNVNEIVDKRVKENTSEIKNKNVTTTNNSSNTSNNNKINTNTKEIKIPNVFSFSSSLEVKMSSNDGASANLEFLLGGYSDIYAMSIASAEMGESGKVYNVVTPKNITMFMDVAGMKMKKTVPQKQFSNANLSDKVPTNPNDLKKTGATKTILGYICYEYKYVNDGGYVSVWATKDFPAKNTNITMLGMREGGFIEGFVLEIDMKSKNETANMKAIKFNKNKSVTINTSEYKSMGF